MTRLGPVALLLTLLAGCAGPQRSMVVLLPSVDGSPGQVTVTNAAGTQVLSQPQEATEIASASSAPGAPSLLDEASVQALFGEALSAMPLPSVRFLLYFDRGSTTLAAESEAQLPRILEAMDQRIPASVSVVGHTDTAGDPERNYRLGLQRAEAVAERLRALGATPSDLEVSSHGEAAPLIPTGDEVAEPRNRRVEVTIR